MFLTVLLQKLFGSLNHTLSVEPLKEEIFHCLTCLNGPADPNLEDFVEKEQTSYFRLKT